MKRKPKNPPEPYMTLAIDRCPSHGYYAVSVNERDEDGGGSGLRLTPSKCCGRWDTLREWRVAPDDLRKMAREIEREADLFDQNHALGETGAVR